MTAFTESAICASTLVCGQCRNREAGRAWRAHLGWFLRLPFDAPDFVCPRGHAWGYEPPPHTPAHGMTAEEIDVLVKQNNGNRPCNGCGH